MAVNKFGKVIYNQTVKRPTLSAHMLNMLACEVSLEACSASNYWARVFVHQGHTVKLINPAHLRPYVKTNKNDTPDAEALCEAASSPTRCYVQPKTLE